jgi:hypothetical protein
MDDGFKKSLADFLKTPSVFDRKRRSAWVRAGWWLNKDKSDELGVQRGLFFS